MVTEVEGYKDVTGTVERKIGDLSEEDRANIMPEMMIMTIKEVWDEETKQWKEKGKGRYCTLGYMQQAGTHYFDCFAPNVKRDSFKFFWALYAGLYSYYIKLQKVILSLIHI